MVLEIWNARVREVRAKYANLRTVVLVKGPDLQSVAVFEVDTDMFLPGDYNWQWNKNRNLEGFRFDGVKKFVWQPSGSQFTITEQIPIDALKLRIKTPPQIDKKYVLEKVGFNNSYFEEI